MTRRWVRRWLVAGAVVVGAPGLTLLAWPGTAPETGTPTLPTEFATYSMFTSHAVDRPAGRAIALFEIGSWELYGTNQTLVVGADRDSYRQVDGGEPNRFIRRRILLSPDGTQVIRRVAGGGAHELELLDLRTGEASPRRGVDWTPVVHDDGPNRIGEDIALLAWSPAGRYVAYAVHAPRRGDNIPGVHAAHQLAILDLLANSATLRPEFEGVYAAAFAPDSRRLALSTDFGGLIVSVDGARLGTWSDPSPVVAGSLAFYPPGGSALAWSPDGTTLAVATTITCGPHADMTGRGPAMTVTAFIDTTTGLPRRPQPPRPCLTPLGWRSPTVLVGEQIRPDGGYGLAEASLVDGTVTPISHFSYGHGCELVGQCDVWRIQLATNLLPVAGIRDSVYPDRGPWVPIVHIALIGAPIAFVGWVFIPLIAERVRERRARRQPPVAPPPVQEMVGS